MPCCALVGTKILYTKQKKKKDKKNLPEQMND
jgi:hypothetical protein